MAARASVRSPDLNLKAELADVLTDLMWDVRWGEDLMAMTLSPEGWVWGLPEHRGRGLGDWGLERLQSCGTSGRRCCTGS